MKHKFLGVAATALAAMTAGVGLAQEASAQATGPTTRWSGAPRTEEEDRRFKVNGRVHYDIFNYDRDVQNSSADDVSASGSFARRVFLGVEGQFTTNWRYNIKVDLAPSAAAATTDGGEVKLDDAFLEYAGDDFSIFIGQNNAISHLEDRTSSNYTPFNERSLINQVSGYTKTFGIAYLMNGGNWSLGGGVYTDSLNDPQPSVAQAESTEMLRYQARATWAPIYQRTPDGVTLLHLGASARLRNQGSSNFAFGSPRAAQNSLAGPAVIGYSITGLNGGYNTDTTLGAEVAFQWNSFGATAEYMTFEGDSEFGNAKPEVDGGYVDIMWSPTGEARNYVASDGSFGRITPRASLGSDGIGHVMLTGRYEWLDASGTDLAAASITSLNRGEMSGYQLGVTWAPIGYVKFQLNYGQYEIDRTGPNTGATRDEDLETMTFRTQFDW